MIEHLVKGLRILGARWWPAAWLAAGQNPADTLVRWGMVVGAGYALWLLVTGSWGLLGAAVLVVVLMALRAATKAVRAEQPAAAEAGHEAPAGDADEGLPDITPDELTTLAHDLLAGGPGVHLATLAAGLSARHGGAWHTGDVRALLAAHQVPVRPSVRDATKRVSPGVHRDDLTPLPDPSPNPAVARPVGVVAAGQPATTPATTAAPTTPTTRRIGGVQVTAIPDPDNPARTHVRVVDRTRKPA